jgi:hypothetical protein
LGKEPLGGGGEKRSDGIQYITCSSENSMMKHIKIAKREGVVRAKE